MVTPAAAPLLEAESQEVVVTPAAAPVFEAASQEVAVAEDGAAALPRTVLDGIQKLTDEHAIDLNEDSRRALHHVSVSEAERILQRTCELAEQGNLFNADGFIVSTCWKHPRESHPQSLQGQDWSRSTSGCHSHADSWSAGSATNSAADEEPQAEELPREPSTWSTAAKEVVIEYSGSRSLVDSNASTEDWGDASTRSHLDSSFSYDSFSGGISSSLLASTASLVAASRPSQTGPRMHLGVTDQLLIDTQVRCLRQSQRDARVWAYLYLLKAFSWLVLAIVITVVSALLFFRASSAGGSSSYMLYYVIWVPLGIITAVFMRVRGAFGEAWDYWNQGTRTHIILRSNENHAEFRAVGRYLEDCGVMCFNARLQIAQDEDDVEEVHLNWSPWARSFLKYACVHGDSGEASSIEFRTFCPGRWLPCLCRSCHGHFEVHYEKGHDDCYDGSTWRGTNRYGGDRSHDTIVISCADHQAEYIENFFLHAHMNYTTPRSTRVEVYSAAPGAENAGVSSVSWEFMQYIPPMAQERTGRFTYVPGPAFSMIEEEYRRVVSIGNESLTVLVTGASRAGKSALVNALAHRLSLPIYNLNLKAKYLIDGGIDALFSYRAIKHRPVLVHIEEFAMMFQETLAPPSDGPGGESAAGQRYEGLQSGSSLRCSDLLKLFDQSGTTSPKRIVFVLTCIELPEQFDRIRELQPLLARGRITHYRMEQPTEEMIAQFVLQYFFPEPKREALSAADRTKLLSYVATMKQRLGGDFKNWHAIVKYAEEIPIGT